MMLKISDWMRVLREHLHIAPIEANVIAIEAKVRVIEDAVKNVIAIEAKVRVIEDAVKNVGVNIATGQALLVNEQKHLEVILTGIENTANKLILAIEDERRHREETKIQLVAEIAAMTNEMKKISDVVDQHIRSTHHDHRGCK